MLLKANHEESDKFISKGQLLELRRGQFITSIAEMEEAFGWSRHKVYRFLSTLENEQMIHKNGTPNGTTITVVNYSFYQDRQNTNGTPDGTSNGTPDGTSNGTPDGTLSTMINNDNNGNNGGARRKSHRKTQREIEEEEDARMMAEWMKEQEAKERNGDA